MDKRDPEDDAWAWLRDYAEQRHGEDPCDVSFDANQMVDAFIAGIEARSTPQGHC